MGGGASKPKTPPVFKLAMTKLSPPDNLINKFLDLVVTGHPGPGKALTKLESSDPDVEAKFSIDKMTFELSRPSNPGIDPYRPLLLSRLFLRQMRFSPKWRPLKRPSTRRATTYCCLLATTRRRWSSSRRPTRSGTLQVSSIEDKGITEFIYNCAITINQGVPVTTMSTPRK